MHSLPTHDVDVERRILGVIRRAHWHVDAARVELALKRLEVCCRKTNFNPNQPRVPAGSRDGGQWTSVEGGGADRQGSNDPRILSDAAPDEEWQPGAQYASNRPSLSRFPNATPAQHARFAAAEVRTNSALDQIRQIDPAWEPRVSSLTVPRSIEGAIAHAEARAQAAEVRLRELASESHGRLLESYRANNATTDLFGRRWDRAQNTVAVATPDAQRLFFGVNSHAPTFTDRDAGIARRTVDSMLLQFPETMSRDNIGSGPNNSVYHAEATVLLRMRDAFGGTLAGRELHVTVDRPICSSCRLVLPRLGTQLGNPTVSYYDGNGLQGIMKRGEWLFWRAK
jgi:hypothetical protein